MLHSRYVPTAAELAAVLRELAASSGTPPTLQQFETFRPEHWASGLTVANHYAPDVRSYARWAAMVAALCPELAPNGATETSNLMSDSRRTKPPPDLSKLRLPNAAATLAALAAVVRLHDDGLVVARINLSRDQQLRVSATLNAARAMLEHDRTEQKAPVSIPGDEAAHAPSVRPERAERPSEYTTRVGRAISVHVVRAYICDNCKGDKEAHPYGVRDRMGVYWHVLCNECFDELGCSYIFPESEVQP